MNYGIRAMLPGSHGNRFKLLVESTLGRRGMISLIIPTYNEAENLPSLFKAIQDIAVELEKNGNSLQVVIVDNTSKDDTWELLKDWAAVSKDICNIRLYQHPVNLGMQQSLLTGLKLTDGEAIAVMQSDLQDPPEVLKQMVIEWSNGSDFVATQIKKRKGAILPRIGAWGFYRLLGFFSDTPILADSSDFYLFDSKYRDSAIRHSGTTPFLRATLTSLALPDVVIPYMREDRQEGVTKFNIKRRINFAIDALLRDLGGLVKRVTIGALTIGGVTVAGLLGLALAYLFGYRSPVGGWLTSTALLLIVLSSTMFIGALSLELLHRIYRDLPRRDYSVGGELIDF